ncbi:MAG: Hint domain-containing protein [Pseudomonadota bacterium]
MEPKTVLRQGKPPVMALQTKLSGFASGTEIVTADGLLPVEHLSKGDRVITRDGGMKAVTWVDATYVTTNAVVIAADALGFAKPESRLVLPEGQHLLLRDWRAKALYGANVVGVPAWRLVDGEYIRRVGPRSLRLYRIGFDAQHTVYAGGLELFAHTETFDIA